MSRRSGSDSEESRRKTAKGASAPYQSAPEIANTPGGTLNAALVSPEFLGSRSERKAHRKKRQRRKVELLVFIGMLVIFYAALRVFAK